MNIGLMLLTIWIVGFVISGTFMALTNLFNDGYDRYEFITILATFWMFTIWFILAFLWFRKVGKIMKHIKNKREIRKYKKMRG